MPVPVASPRDVGLAIRERRRALGLDQAGLAKKVGVGRQWIISVERGKPGAELGLVLRALKELDLRVLVEPRAAVQPGEPDIDAILDRARARR
jgi:HTH-type transcriptional regulator / antitoxin HipB